MNERLTFQLDWSTRHLKNLQKQYPPEPQHLHEALFMFGIMKVCCDLMDINILDWCNATNLPYRKRQSDYQHLFFPKEPFNIQGVPMQKVGTYYELIQLIKKKDWYSSGKE